MSDDELAKMPVAMRTPITEAGAILCELAEIYKEITKADDFLEKYFGEMWSDETTNGDKGSADFYQMMNETPEEMEKVAGFCSMLISCAYCVQAMKEYLVNNKEPTNLAWAYVSEANFWRYFVKHIIVNNEENEKILSNNASQAARARYAKDKKQQQLKEIKDQFLKNKDKFKERGYTANFVRKMASKYDEIKEIKTIANRVAMWKKENQ